MAISARKKALIKEVVSSAGRLRNAATWATSRKPLSISEDFVFELYLLFSALRDLSRKYHIRFEPGTKGAFPRKPANKAGWPRFILKDKVNGMPLYQICPGTAIRDMHGGKRHPDISFQTADSPDDPNYEHCVMIWDAKYRDDETDRITHLEFSAFAHWVEVLDLRGKAPFSIEFTALSAMQHNCLVTNGVTSTETNAERNRVTMKEVSGFRPGNAHTVFP